MWDCVVARWWTEFSEGCGYATIPDVSFESSIFDYRPDLDLSGNAR